MTKDTKLNMASDQDLCSHFLWRVRNPLGCLYKDTGLHFLILSITKDNCWWLRLDNRFVVQDTAEGAPACKAMKTRSWRKMHFRSLFPMSPNTPSIPKLFCCLTPTPSSRRVDEWSIKAMFKAICCSEGFPHKLKHAGKAVLA